MARGPGVSGWGELAGCAPEARRHPAPTRIPSRTCRREQKILAIDFPKGFRSHIQGRPPFAACILVVHRELSPASGVTLRPPSRPSKHLNALPPKAVREISHLAVNSSNVSSWWAHRRAVVPKLAKEVLTTAGAARLARAASGCRRGFARKSVDEAPRAATRRSVEEDIGGGGVESDGLDAFFCGSGFTAEGRSGEVGAG